MPALQRILETVLYVADLARSRTFYENALELVPMASDADFCAYGIGTTSVLILFVRGTTLEDRILRGGTIPHHDGHGCLHFAFAIAAEDLPKWRVSLAEKGVALAGRMNWPRGGTSLYFRDPDEHLVELATPGIWPSY